MEAEPELKREVARNAHLARKAVGTGELDASKSVRSVDAAALGQCIQDTCLHKTGMIPFGCLLEIHSRPPANIELDYKHGLPLLCKD